MQGIFITLEGNEGSGKSTQQKIIADYLQSKNKQVLQTREPGGTKLGEELRALLLNYEAEKIDPITETLLLFAARTHHIENVIKPALQQGVWVICDRFIDSSYAYQGAGRKVDLAYLDSLTQMSVKDILPDISFYFATDWQTSQARQKTRGNIQDRFEKSGKDFFEAVESGFQAQAKKQKRIQTINSKLPLEQVSQQIFDYLNKFLSAN